MPKPNMYQSLHTSVMTERGQPFEIQIRTHEMHRVAEEGIAAHWQYKEGRPLRTDDAEKVAWLRQILDWQQDLKDPRDFLELVKSICIPRRSTPSRPRASAVFPQRGRRRSTSPMRSTPRSATTASGAKVNGKIVPLKYVLRERRHRRDPDPAEQGIPAGTGWPWPRPPGPAARSGRGSTPTSDQVGGPRAGTDREGVAQVQVVAERFSRKGIPSLRS